MLKFIKFFQGYLYVVIRGYSPERFLNLCSSRNIVLWNLLPAEDGYSFCISLKAFRQIKPLLKKTGTRITIKKRYGLPFLMFRYRKHRFFLFGIISAFVVLGVMSQFIWKVEITGNSFYSSQVLTDFLEESGVGYGVAKIKTDCGEIETLLRNQFDDITWVSARISGTRLYLIVQERISQGESEEEAEDTPANLVSDCTGTVVSVTTRRGTPMVVKGDTVEKGTVLVSGQVDIMDDAGEVASSNYIRADADVLIQTKIPYKNVFSRIYEQAEYTGKKKYHVQLIFNDYQLAAGSKEPGEGSWDNATQIFPVKVGEDFYLPFQIGVTRYEQYEIKEYTYTDDEIKEKAERELELYYENLRKNGIQILENSVMIDENENEVAVSGNLNIIKQADTFRKIKPSDIQEGKENNGTDTTDDGNSD